MGSENWKTPRRCLVREVLYSPLLLTTLTSSGEVLYLVVNFGPARGHIVIGVGVRSLGRVLYLRGVFALPLEHEFMANWSEHVQPWNVGLELSEANVLWV